jgi:alpha-beta hydrolase superfamily lysophospholipase
MLTIIASVAIGGYILICAALYLLQERLIFYPEVLASDFTFTLLGRFEEIALPSDGAAISALYFKAFHPKGVVLYFHGNAGSLRSWGSIAETFVERGYDVLMPDYRGYGKSSGHIASEQMLHDDAAVVYQYLLAHYPEDQIVIYGRSIGSGIATYLAKTHRPHMLILETPYFSLKEVVRHHYPFVPGALLKYPFRTDLWIGDVACPVYLFHGTSDDLIPHGASERLAALIRTEHELITIVGGGHNDLDNFEQYGQKLDRILGVKLSSAGIPVLV